jgi:ABC-type polar amino acid transport system ATPase subunit
MIELRAVDKWYQDFHVLKSCTTEVARGEVVVVCGPSGSGKSTLIKCVNGLEPFQKGEITVDGVSVGGKGTDLPKLRARIGMVFQNFELYPHMTVAENIRLAQEKVLGRSRAEAEDKAQACWRGSDWPTRRASIRASFPAGSSSASPSPARWPWTRSPCCSTNRLRRSTRR